MRGFRRERGHLVAELDPTEREAVAGVVADVAQLLGAEPFDDPDPDVAQVGADPAGALGHEGFRVGPAIPTPDDDAVHRLLPDASRDDPQVSAEFRRLTEEDLRRTKIARLHDLWSALRAEAPSTWPSSALVVTPDRAADLAATLTDLRLVLAQRLGVEDEESSEELYDRLDEVPVASGDPVADAHAEVRRYLSAIYAALSWLQETLLALLLDDLQHPGESPSGKPDGSPDASPGGTVPDARD